MNLLLESDGKRLASKNRRDLIKGAAAAMGLVLTLPASRLLAAAASTAAPQASTTSAAIGYWRQGSIASSEPSDVISDGRSLVSSPGAYELRVLGVDTDVLLALDAEYPGGARHRFWQAWKEGSLMQRSPMSAIRWWAGDGSPLHLDVSLRGGSASTRVAAKPGTYVLAVGSGEQALPSWSDLALRPRVAGSFKDMLLISRANGKVVKFPHVLLAVQQIAA